MIPEETLNNRITYLRGVLRAQLRQAGRYSLLSEIEKIPLRIKAAELLTLEEYKADSDLDFQISSCVFNEQYCGAAGVKRAKEWIERIF